MTPMVFLFLVRLIFHGFSILPSVVGKKCQYEQDYKWNALQCNSDFVLEFVYYVN